MIRQTVSKSSAIHRATRRACCSQAREGINQFANLKTERRGNSHLKKKINPALKSKMKRQRGASTLTGDLQAGVDGSHVPDHGRGMPAIHQVRLGVLRLSVNHRNSQPQALSERLCPEGEHETVHTPRSTCFLLTAIGETLGEHK